MLQKENRLTKKDDFGRIHKRGRFCGDEFLAIRFLPNGLDVTRVGFLVGLKISKKAVIRNKIKRILREVFRLKIKNCKLKKGFDIIVLVRPEIIGKSYTEVNQALDRVLSMAGIV
ncbi:MAG: ribonuclease P protein component [Patescibacteria group bacterium]|jgi:ribonuclease P protein component